VKRTCPGRISSYSGGNRLLDFDDELGLLEDFTGAGKKLSSGGGVVLILKAAAKPCPLLDENGVPMLAQYLHARGRERNAVLPRLDFARYADDHWYAAVAVQTAVLEITPRAAKQQVNANA
jgi:hypothetical protein